MRIIQWCSNSAWEQSHLKVPSRCLSTARYLKKNASVTLGNKTHKERALNSFKESTLLPHQLPLLEKRVELMRQILTESLSAIACGRCDWVISPRHHHHHPTPRSLFKRSFVIHAWLARLSFEFGHVWWLNCPRTSFGILGKAQGWCVSASAEEFDKGWMCQQAE